MRESSIEARHLRASESFGSAREAIGAIGPGARCFAVTRGQWSMIDAVLVALDACGVSRVSIWTWTVADYEVECLARLRQDGRIKSGLLVIDGGARNKNADIIGAWQGRFGSGSVRYVRNHAKIATVEGNGLRLLLRGSMNLNHNPRFEQFDMSEGCAGFDLVRQIEAELPALPDSASGAEVIAATRLGDAWGDRELQAFRGLKEWRPK